MPVEANYNWTGFYVGGGGGYGMLDADQHSLDGGVQSSIETRAGGRGYFGTVSGGYDWQINPTWVVGIFGDAQFGDINSTIANTDFSRFGTTKNNLSYAAGARIGYLVAPNVLSYINGGWSHAEFKGTDLTSSSGLPSGSSIGNFSRDGWFVGGGFENTLSFLGLNAPGWFLKTEYRFAQYDSKAEFIDAATGFGVAFKPYEQTISTQLVYKFNWGR